MHGIHHSIVPAERDSNWSSGLSLWDRLHGTYREDVIQSDIDIGVADSRAAADLSLPASLSAPFKRIPMSVE
jgi:sterol desaturase/sphingolipid hydroxylase (fatty acid hydroxylase superfamily)